MAVTTATSMPGAGRAMKIMEERGPALQAATQQLERFESRLHDTEQLLTMPRAQRLAGCSRPLYEACWEQSTEMHKKLGFGIAIGTLFAGAIGGAFASLAGHPQLAGLIAGGSLFAMFKVVPQTYAAVVKKFILPGQMDPLVIGGLERERDSLKAAVPQARDYKQRLESEIEAELSAPEPPQPSIQVEEAYVVIGGMKIPVRK